MRSKELRTMERIASMTRNVWSKTINHSRFHRAITPEDQGYYSLLDVNVNCLFGNKNFVDLRTTQTVCLATKFSLYFTDTKHKVHNSKLDLKTEIANVKTLYKGDLRAESCN